MSEYHAPVMLQECLEGLKIKPDGTYVDVTFGGGGHSRAILERLGPEGRLVAFDQDADAHANLPTDDRLIFVPHNFRFLKRFLKLHGIRAVDGILGDLGVSSHQFDAADRGFSFRFEADLDMRMNQGGERTAADILNEYRVAELQQVLGRYGEVRNAKTLAEAIVQQRQIRPYKRIEDLLEVCGPLIRGQKNRYLAQVFQALRIEVNDEMAALQDMLTQTREVLDQQGRLVIMSYHSLEDRLVKKFMKSGNVDGDIIKDDFGHIDRVLGAAPMRH